MFGKLNKNSLMVIIPLMSMADALLFSFIGQYTMLYCHRQLSNGEYGIVRVIAVVVTMATLHFLQSNIDKAIKYLISIQVANCVFSVIARFLVATNPMVFSLVTSTRNSLSIATVSVFEDLENSIFQKREKTLLTIKNKKYTNMGELISMVLLILFPNISMDVVCEASVVVLIILYSYEIWLGMVMKRLVDADSLELELNKYNLNWE